MSPAGCSSRKDGLREYLEEGQRCGDPPPPGVGPCRGQACGTGDRRLETQTGLELRPKRKGPPHLGNHQGRPWGMFSFILCIYLIFFFIRVQLIHNVTFVVQYGDSTGVQVMQCSPQR